MKQNEVVEVKGGTVVVTIAPVNDLRDREAEKNRG